MDFDEIYELARTYAARADVSGVAGQPAVYEAELTGSDGGTLSAEISNNRVTIYKGPRPGCLCSVSASPESLARMLEGKLNPMTAIATGRVKVRGDISALMRLRDVRLK